MVHEYRGFDFCYIGRRGRAAIKWGGRRQIRAKQCSQSIRRAAAEAEAGCAHFGTAEGMNVQPLRACDEILSQLRFIDLVE